MLQLFKTWPVVPQGPWPSPAPFPSSVPESDRRVAVATDDLLQQRLSKLVTLLSHLHAARDTIEGDASAPQGFYGLAQSVLRVAVTGRAMVNNELTYPCGFNITCIADHVFKQHLPLSGACVLIDAPLLC